MGPFFVFLLIVVSLLIAGKICKILNKNTIGTTWAYITRFVVVFLITLGILGGIVGNLLLKKDTSSNQPEQTRDSSSEESNSNSNTDNPLLDLLQGENDEHIIGVKGGTNSAYPGVTYGEAFEKFFSRPSWKYFVGTQEGPDEDGDGKPDYTVENVDVVEFTGNCLYSDVEVTALIQFVLDNEAGTFQPVYLSFNEVPQNMLMLAGLMDTVFSEAIGSDGSVPTTPSNTDVTEPPQEDHPDTQPDSDFVGTWTDADSMYQMDVSCTDDVYTIEVYQQQVDGESRQWSLEGYSEEGNGIFYSGVYVELYLRDDGTVGGGGAPNDAAGVIFLTDDGVLHWDSDTGELETAVLLTKN